MRRLFLMMSFAVSLAACRPTATAFQPPLTAVQAWLTTNGYAVTVHYRVYDPDLAVAKESQRRYDGTSLAYWVVQGLTTRDGVVAWRAINAGQFSSFDTEVAFALYDPARTAWMEGRRTYSGNASMSWELSRFTTAGGVVVWEASPTGPFAPATAEVNYTTYDPSRGVWMTGVQSYTGTAASYWVVNNLTLASGMVAWQAAATGEFAAPDREVGCAIYDPGRGAWSKGTRRYDGTVLAYWTNSAPILADGIVAWKAELSGEGSNRASEVSYTLYDPSRGAWMTSWRRYEGNTQDYWTVTNLAVSSQMVQWTARRGLQSTNEVRGYDPPGGVWQAAPNTPLAWWLASATEGDAPLRVWLGDLSIGGTAWSWDLGNGTTSLQRNPYVVFTQPGLYTVTQTVSGPGGASSAIQTITVFGQSALRFDPASAHVTNGEFHVRLDGLSGRWPVVIWSSTDLLVWTPLLTNAPVPGPIELVDPVGSNPSARFYRASELR